jgi:hypothetical protein
MIHNVMRILLINVQDLAMMTQLVTNPSLMLISHSDCETEADPRLTNVRFTNNQSGVSFADKTLDEPLVCGGWNVKI